MISITILGCFACAAKMPQAVIQLTAYITVGYKLNLQLQCFLGYTVNDDGK